MKTVMVWMAGALFASMTLAAGNGPTMEERARVKYGRTAMAATAAPTGATALPAAEQWRRAKLGLAAVRNVPAHCPGCTVHGTAIPERVAQAHVKYGLALPVQSIAHTCCAHGE